MTSSVASDDKMGWSKWVQAARQQISSLYPAASALLCREFLCIKSQNIQQILRQLFKFSVIVQIVPNIKLRGNTKSSID